MATLPKYDIDTVAAMLTAGMEDALREAIRRKLAEHADAVVREAATDMARHLRVKLMTYRDASSGGVQVPLIIDGVEDAPGIIGGGITK